MSEQINLRQIFQSKIRNQLYVFLIKGALQGWEYKTVFQIVDQAIEQEMWAINGYVSKNNITLLNMDSHVDAVVKQILIPNLEKRRVQ